MKIENIRKIAKEVGVVDEKLCVAFLNERFPDESDNIEVYFKEWCYRFKNGTPEVYMDEESRDVYEEVKRRIKEGEIEK